MRIALDCRTIKPWKTGLGRYAYALIRHLAQLDRDNEYIILKSPLLPQRLIAQENFRELTLAGTPEDARNVCGHLGILDHERVDIFHALYHFLPRSVRARRVMITCHDLIWMDHPWLAFADFWRGLGIKVWGTLAIGRALRNADAIVCISEATRAAVERHMRRPKNLRVIYHGSESLWHDATPTTDESPLAVPSTPYFLMVGHTKPYKNAPGAVRAMAELVRRHPEARLVFVGRGDNYHDLRKLVTQLRLDPHVIFLPQASDSALTTLYHHACALLQPSLTEGFGFPVVEAMQAGCPVIAANRAALPEVLGDAGILIDPTNSTALANAMAQLLTDPALRAQCIDRGHSQVQKFTWESTARQTLDLYNQLSS